jgi:hypothetical protein
MMSDKIVAQEEIAKYFSRESTNHVPEGITNELKTG